MSFDPTTHSGQNFKIGEIVTTSKFGGTIIMIAKLAESRYQYTIELPCSLFIQVEEVNKIK